MSHLKNDLPSIYQNLLDENFLNLYVEEKLATCNDCYKAKKTSPKPHYDAKLKCCTYYPFIPNYLVGALLSEAGNEWSHATPILKKLIRDRRYVLPIGVCAPPEYQKLFREKKLEDFGNREDLLCPFYKIENGGCSVWRFRGHECATFFCVSSQGQKGEEFWQKVRGYLHDVEMQLSQNCMVQKGYTPREIEQNLEFIKLLENDKMRNSIDNSPRGFAMAAPQWAQTWIHHQDDIEEYFKDCFKFVMNNKNNLKKDFKWQT